MSLNIQGTFTNPEKQDVILTPPQPETPGEKAPKPELKNQGIIYSVGIASGIYYLSYCCYFKISYYNLLNICNFLYNATHIIQNLVCTQGRLYNFSTN
jgi:hypothetical protein